MNLGDSKTTKGDFKQYQSKNLPGLIHNKEFAHSIGQLKSSEFGAKWLTWALQVTQAIPETIKVEELVEVEDISKKVGGGAADKVLLEVRYSDPAFDQAPTRFFVKLPCCDIKNKWRAAALDSAGPEVMFSHLFCSPTCEQIAQDFPMKTAKVYFCDINPKSTNFILIQEFLNYSDGTQGSLLPAPEKCKNYLLEGGPGPYYQSLLNAGGELCGWHQAIKDTELGARIAKCFPNNAIKLKMPKHLRGLQRFLIYWTGRSLMYFSMNFIKNACPQLCPEDCLTQESLSTFQKEYQEVLYHFPEVMDDIMEKGRTKYFAYGHPNLDVDNAFFFKDDHGQLKCGGIDFGGYQGGNMLFFLAGSLGTADDQHFCKDEKKLIATFAKAYNQHAPKSIDAQALLNDWKVFAILPTFISSFMSILAAKKISWRTLKQVKTPQDPVFANNFEGRCFTQLTISGFVRWKHAYTFDAFKQWQKTHRKKGISRGLSWYLLYKPLHPIHALVMHSILLIYRITKR